MKNYIVLLIVVCITFVSCGSNVPKGYNGFYKQHKNDANVISFELPGILAKVVLKNEDEEAKALADKLDKLSFLIVDEQPQAMEQALATFLEESEFKKLMVIKDGGTEIIILIHEFDGEINEVVMKVNDEESLVVLCAVGQFTKEDAGNIAKSINIEGARSMN